MDESVDYCRQLEAYLCQKNGGHLVRIVGPAFEKVREWSAQGVPLKIAFRGIDRCCDRANARGGRRRPLRIEFCEADILDVFDDWRRAIGVSAASGTDSPADERVEPRKGPLAAHIQRCVTRLLAPKSTPHPEFDAVVEGLTRELDALAVRAKGGRGEGRAEIVDRLAELDVELLRAARARIDSRTSAALQVEADAELGGLASRMNADALTRARRLAFERLLRDSLNLPVLAYD